MVEIKLKKYPKNATIIEGFPGFGLVGTIATEFLINHLETEIIGKVWFENLPATVAVHKKKLVNPIGVYYNKKYNLIIIHAITGTNGVEWDAARAIIGVAKKLKSKEIICIEGVGSNMPTQSNRVFYYTNKEDKKKKLESLEISALDEGIVMGVTSALILEAENIPITALFAETQTNLPDSKAAAQVIKVLDQYLKLNVDYKPLLKTAELFEDKLKGILQQSKTAKDNMEKKQLSYVG